MQQETSQWYQSKKLNNMPQLRNEIYDDNGLVRVEFIQIDEPTQEELIAQKEAQLLEMFEELKRLKGNA
jgi:hypothetical protein